MACHCLICAGGAADEMAEGAAEGLRRAQPLLMQLSVRIRALSSPRAWLMSYDGAPD